MAKGPVLIEMDDTPPPSVAEAAPVPDATPQGRAMQTVGALSVRRPSRLLRWVWGSAIALVSALVTAAAWQFVTDWIATQPLVGWAFAALIAVFVLSLLLLTLREIAALGRLRRVDTLRHRVLEIRETGDTETARRAMAEIKRFYKGRDDIRWALDRYDSLAPDQMDAQGLLDLGEREIMSPLDKAAEQAVERAARQVATVTALVPLALADVVAALTANVRMIRQVAEIYGGRAGTLGAWRLTRAVMAHLVATGAVAVGDDMLEPILGGSILGKLSRRFGEGLVNGALTARVGVAAIEVCRPMPFAATSAPKARDLIKGALSGLVMRGD